MERRLYLQLGWERYWEQNIEGIKYWKERRWEDTAWNQGTTEMLNESEEERVRYEVFTRVG